MSETFLKLSKDIRDTILQSSLRYVENKKEILEPQYVYTGTLESFKLCVEDFSKSKDTLFYKLIMEILTHLEEWFNESCLEHVSGIVIERLGLPLLTVENADLLHVHKYKIVIDIREIITKSSSINIRTTSYNTDNRLFGSILIMGLVSLGLVVYNKRN